MSSSGGAHQSDLIETDIIAYLNEHQNKDLLRLLTCGSVDDGKSTLIGRLLYDSKLLYEDQLAAVTKDSSSHGHAGDQVDLALLMDGLKAEREQGITIDVAYRYFSTSRRKFVIADTPGHEQYTRNMVTGASTCDLAIILIDARKGLLPQTRRHSSIAALLGIRHVGVAVNKMDLCDWSQEVFDTISAAYRTEIADRVGITDPLFIPLSALNGDNVVDRSEAMDWYDGPTLMEHLEHVELRPRATVEQLRFPVQLVLRPDLDFRGYAGTVAAGVVRPGDRVEVVPSGVTTTVERIVSFDGDLREAGPGRSVVLTFAEEVDASRGDVIVHRGDTVARSHAVAANVVWMAEDEVASGRSFLMMHNNRYSNATIDRIEHRIDITTLEQVPAEQLALNDIAHCTLRSDRELIFDGYEENRTTGSFILVDRLTNATVAAGMLLPAADAWDATPNRRITGRSSSIDIDEREQRLNQVGATVFLTGLTAAGKTTIARALERTLFDAGWTTVRLDGENMRLGISRDLGFSAQERSENVRRTAEIARLLNDQGIIAICALAAPKSSVRERARELIGRNRFIEVFVDTPLDVCRERDAEGLYEAADRGEIPQFPGVSATYDRPADADLTLDTVGRDTAACVEQIVALLRRRGILRG